MRNPLLDRKVMWLGMFGGNLAAFALLACAALEFTHHHWIVPAFAGLLLAEAWLAKKYFGAARALWLRGLLPWLAVTGGALAWRQASMFRCWRHCEGRLALGLLLLAAAAYLATQGLERRGEKLFSVLLCTLLLAWAGVVISLGTLRGTLALF